MSEKLKDFSIVNEWNMDVVTPAGEMTLICVMFQGPGTFGYISSNLFPDSSKPALRDFKIENEYNMNIDTPHQNEPMPLICVMFQGPGTFGYVSSNLFKDLIVSDASGGASKLRF